MSAYLEPGVAYKAYALSPEINRVTPYTLPVTKEQELRVRSIFERHPIIPLHDN